MKKSKKKPIVYKRLLIHTEDHKKLEMISKKENRPLISQLKVLLDKEIQKIEAA